jgi:hypothetical protein
MILRAIPKKSVAVVLPAVAKMLDAVNKLEMGII